MRVVVEMRDDQIDLAVAALVSMSCPLCPLQLSKACSCEPQCRKLAEHILGGELSEVYGQGEE